MCKERATAVINSGSSSDSPSDSPSAAYQMDCELWNKIERACYVCFYFSSGIFMCALGRERPNLTIYQGIICPIQDLLQGKALILWYVNSDDFKVCGKYGSLKIIL